MWEVAALEDLGASGECLLHGLKGAEDSFVDDFEFVFREKICDVAIGFEDAFVLFKCDDDERDLIICSG